MVKVAVFVSGGGTNLQAILDAQNDVICSAKVALVVSSSADAYALQRAEKHGVPGVVLRDEAEIQRTLEEYGIGLIVLAGYMRILSSAFTARWDKRILNVHPSLIPSFCGKGMYGLRVHEAALGHTLDIYRAEQNGVYYFRTVDGEQTCLEAEVEVVEI